MFSLPLTQSRNPLIDTLRGLSLRWWGSLSSWQSGLSQWWSARVACCWAHQWLSLSFQVACRAQVSQPHKTSTESVASRFLWIYRMIFKDMEKRRSLEGSFITSVGRNLREGRQSSCVPGHSWEWHPTELGDKTESGVGCKGVDWSVQLARPCCVLVLPLSSGISSGIGRPAHVGEERMRNHTSLPASQARTKGIWV